MRVAERRRQRRTLYILTPCLLIWFGAVWRSAVFGVPNVDEAFYLTASHLVSQGQILYRDFAFTQGPVMPYVYGVVLGLIGTNLAIGRFVSVALSALAVAFVLNIAHRLGGIRAAVLAFILLMATPAVLYYLALVKPYSLAAVLTLWALALVLHSGPSPSARWPFLSTVVAGLSVLTRLSFLPVVVFVSLLWVRRRHWRASGLGLLILGLVTLVVAASSDGNLLFDVLQFHLWRVREGATQGSIAALAMESAIVFAPALVLAVVLLALWRRVPGFQGRLVEWWLTGTDAKVLLLLVATALAFVHFIQPAEFWEYQIPGYLLVVVLLAAVSASLVDVSVQPVRTALLAISVVASSLGVWTFMSSTMWPPTNALLNASKVSEILTQRGTSGDTLLGRFNHLALAGGLQVYPGNEMGMFSVADGSSPAETTRRHFLSMEAVANALAGCSVTFVAVDDRWGHTGTIFQLTIPSLLQIPEATRKQWRDLLQEKYRIIYADEEVTIFERIKEKCDGITQR